MCNKNKKVLSQGDTLKFSKLAETMETIAEQGADAFYTGKIGRDLIQDIQAQGLGDDRILLVGGIDGKSKWAETYTLKDKNKLSLYSAWFF